VAPTLQHVVPEDLGAVARLEALRQETRARGWRRGRAAQRHRGGGACPAGGAGALQAVRGTAAGTALGGHHQGRRGHSAGLSA